MVYDVSSEATSKAEAGGAQVFLAGLITLLTLILSIMLCPMYVSVLASLRFNRNSTQHGAGGEFTEAGGRRLRFSLLPFFPFPWSQPLTTRDLSTFVLRSSRSRTK